MKRAEVIDLINKERERQNELHPEWHGIDHGLAVLAEEFGEVARAVYELNHSYRNNNNSSAPILLSIKELREELVQVAAVCLRWLETEF